MTPPRIAAPAVYLAFIAALLGLIAGVGRGLGW